MTKSTLSISWSSIPSRSSSPPSECSSVKQDHDEKSIPRQHSESETGGSGLTVWYLARHLVVLLEAQAGSSGQVPQDGSQRGSLTQMLRLPFWQALPLICLLVPPLFFLDYLAQEVLRQLLCSSLNVLLFVSWLWLVEFWGYGQNLCVLRVWNQRQLRSLDWLLSVSIDTLTQDQTDFFGVGGVDPFQFGLTLFQLRLNLIFVTADLP